MIKHITKHLRLFLLYLILAGAMIIHFLHINSGAMYPSVHAICPLGGLENLWAWAGGKANLQKLFSGTMTLFFFTLAFALIFGRAFCGNICPFGALQELTGKITKKKIAVPEKPDKILRLTKYLLLVFITVMAWITATIWISPYDPYAAFAHIWDGPKGIIEAGIAGFIILIFVLAASVFIERFFCKYLCPAGALYGAVSKIAASKIKRGESCKQCSNTGAACKANAACPMNINLSEAETVKSPECIACGDCVNACCASAACKSGMKMTIGGKKIKLSVFTIGTVLVFFLGIFVFDRTGLFQVTVPSLEPAAEAESRGSPPEKVAESGNHLKIADLRGSMSIEAGAKYAGMELSAFYELMEIPRTVPKETWLKDVSRYVPGYDFHVIKANK
jgi:polyferredoxin